MSSEDRDQHQHSPLSLLEELLDELGESYANLVGANAALDTVNRDLDGCVSFVQRRRDRSLRADAKAKENERVERNGVAQRQEDLDNSALPGEIEKILAKARRVVSVTPSATKRGEAKAGSQGKSDVGSNGRTQQRHAEKQNEEAVSTHHAHGKKASTADGRLRDRPAATNQNAAAAKPSSSFKPLRLPARIRDLRIQAHRFGQDLFTHGQFVAGASHLFNRQLSELFQEEEWECCASPSPFVEEEGDDSMGDDSLGGGLQALCGREGELILRLENLEGMSHSEQAMVRANLKAVLEKRHALHRKMSALSDYGQQWKDLATADGDDGPEKEKKKKDQQDCLLGKLTSRGKMNSLSIRWAPDHLVTTTGDVGSILQKPCCVVSCGASGAGKFQRKHEILAKARSLVQQKLLQLRIEETFMSRLLQAIGNMRRDTTSLFSSSSSPKAAVTREEDEEDAFSDDYDSSDSSADVDIGRRSVREAVALERLVALCRLHQQLYLDFQSKPQVGFFFRQSSQQ